MRLVRRGSQPMETNGRARDMADAARKVLRPIIGDGLAQDVANNAASVFTFEDESESFPEAVRECLMQRLRHPATYRAEHLTPEMIEDAVAAVENMDTRLRPNRRSSKRAATLGGRASMRTDFGREVDPDRVTGPSAAELDAALDRYETFHAKRPMRTVMLPDLPKSVVPIGQVLSTMYRTDKWHEDGDDEDYKHVHDNSRGGKDKEYEFGKGVIAYEPAHQVKRSRIEGRSAKNFAGPTPAIRFPVHMPKATTLLGYCLGFFVQRFDDNEVYELNPRGCYLFCSPKGDMLAVYSPDKQPDGSHGWLMVMAGGGLRVLKDGIDG